MHATQGTSHSVWSYEGDDGPAHWGDLDPEYALAKTGRRQSPIDFRSAATQKAGAPSLIQIQYRPAPLRIVHNGHTIEVLYEPGSWLGVGTERYELTQFHFHSPSEHTVDGQQAAMEVHLVHEDPEGRATVIGVLFRPGREHPGLGQVWPHLPSGPIPERSIPEVRVDAGLFLSADAGFFLYSGSLTTPPCTEGIRWLVQREPSEASAAQIADLSRVIHGNNRPTQPLCGRHVEVLSPA